MAQLPLFGLASSLLSMITDSDSPFRKAYQWVKPILEANDDLDKLKETIQLIHAVLLDAEKRQKDSAMVQIWIQRVKDVLYEADVVFDEVATDYLLKQQEEGNQMSKKVRRFFSMSNPFISNDSIAKRVEAIRKRVDDVSKDIAQFNFILSRSENQSGLRKRAETRPFVDEKVIVGRGDDKKAVLDILLHDQSNVETSVSVIAIVGIGGMGKTTLAQLIHNHEEVHKNFDKKWWACISDIVGETNVLERIVQSVSGESHCIHDLKQLLRESVSNTGKYLLVLDDVWDNDLGIWFDIMSLLSSGTNGSKIIVTTRFLSVPRAMQKDKCQIYRLNGLSEEKSWELFKRIAFTEEQVKNPNWVSLGREIVKKCANVPLAIKSVAGLLCTKDTMLEWESVKNEKLLSDDSIRSVLKLSYDHLPSNLKHCFAYCSLYPKDSILYKQNLIYLWIAQGYVKPKENETLEAAGHSYFMELFRRSFFQEAEGNFDGEILYCKMHDLVHDLAQDVAGKESVTLTNGFSQFHKKIRHASVADWISDSWNVPPPLLEANRLRSFLFMHSSRSSVDQQVMKFRFLRALNLQRSNLKNLPHSIGEMKYLRYLNLSLNNEFQVLPDSITKLVNLLTLDLRFCGSLIALPNEFRKLISLRHLDITECISLKHMPPRFGELTSLQHLSDFKVSRSEGKGLDALVGLNLQGKLRIEYDSDDGWSEDELRLERGQIYYSIDVLHISGYPSMRIPVWWKEDIKLKSLKLSGCRKVKNLPPLRCLPFLGDLKLWGLDELEYIEEEEFVSTTPFFPSLRLLELKCLPKLVEWTQKSLATTNEECSVRNPEQSSFPLLSHLLISRCLLLKSMPPSPQLQQLCMFGVREEIVHQLVSTSSLQRILIWGCNNLTSFHGEGLTSLRRLQLRECPSLKNVRLVSIALEELSISSCPDPKLWDYTGEKRAFVNLRQLFLDQIPETDKLPDCLRHRIELGKLQIEQHDLRANERALLEYLKFGMNSQWEERI